MDDDDDFDLLSDNNNTNNDKNNTTHNNNDNTIDITKNSIEVLQRSESQRLKDAILPLLRGKQSPITGMPTYSNDNNGNTNNADNSMNNDVLQYQQPTWFLVQGISCIIGHLVMIPT